MNKRLLIILIISLLQLTCLQSNLHADILESFEFSECCYSLAWDNGTLWCSGKSQMYNIDTSGQIISSFNLPFYSQYGWKVAFDGQYFWVANDFDNQIIKMDATGTNLSSFEYRPIVGDITFDGEYLWIIDAENHRIEKVDTTGNIIQSMRTPGLHAQAVTFDGEYLWIGDYPNIYQVDQTGNVVFQIYYPDGSWHGLTYDGEYLWAAVCTDNGSTINRFDADRQTGTYEHFRWVFHTKNDVTSSPAIGSDGTIYVRSDDWNLYAINPDGTLKWSFTTEECCLTSSPAIASDGTVYIKSEGKDRKVYALNLDGTVKWSFELPPGLSGSSDSFAIGADGTVYTTLFSYSSDDYNLVALNPDGTEKWGATGPSFMGLAIGIEGTLYAGTSEGYLYAIDPAGATKWRVQTDGTLEFPPAIGADGTIYVLAGLRLEGRLYAISPCGWVDWKTSLQGNVYSAPVIADDGTIYAGMYTFGNRLYAVNPDGTVKTEVDVEWAIGSSPAVGKDGTVFVGVADRIAAISASGEQKWVFFTGGTILSSPAIAPDGTLYVGSNDGNLYALNTGCGGLAESSWPMYQQNPLHTGRTVVEAPMPDCSKCPSESVLGDDNKAVENLRSFRDRVLVKTVFGNKLIEFYYSNADRVTAFLANHPVIKESARRVLQYALSVVRD